VREPLFAIGVLARCNVVQELGQFQVGTLPFKLNS
jgi:hypothetical protein